MGHDEGGLFAANVPSTGYAMLCLCPTTPGDSLRYKYDKAGHRQLALAMIRQRLGPYGGGGLMRPQVREVCFDRACDTANGAGRRAAGGRGETGDWFEREAQDAMLDRAAMKDTSASRHKSAQVKVLAVESLSRHNSNLRLRVMDPGK